MTFFDDGGAGYDVLAIEHEAGKEADFHASCVPSSTATLELACGTCPRRAALLWTRSVLPCRCSRASWTRTTRWPDTGGLTVKQLP